MTKNQLRKLIESKAKDRGHAFMFAALTVFSGIFIHRCVFSILAKSTESMDLVEAFSASALNELTLNWVLLIFLTLHAIRLQLGIMYTIYDQTFCEALLEFSEDDVKRLLAHEAAIRILMSIFIGVLPYMLYACSYWWVWGNLLGQVLLFVWWWYVNAKRVWKDTEWWKNGVIATGDILFAVVVVIVYIHGPGATVVTASPSETGIGIALVMVVGFNALVLLFETVLSYGSALVNAASCFTKVVFCLER